MRKRNWLSHMLTLLTVVAAAHIAGAGTANAARTDHDTEGINAAAGSVTTHGGKVITGITFVSEEDLVNVRHQLAKSTTAWSTVADEGLRCLPTWHYITAGGINAYWKPHAPEHVTFIFANGNRSADYWNQQFLPCFRIGWEINAWAFLSNATGYLVDHYNYFYIGAKMIRPWMTAEMIDEWAKFLVCHLDGNWIYLLHHDDSPKYVYRDPADLALLSTVGPLNGNHLFHIDTPILTGIC